MGLLLAIVDASIVSTALVTIGRDFNDFVEVVYPLPLWNKMLTTCQTYWIVLSYLLAYMSIHNKPLERENWADGFQRFPSFGRDLAMSLGING